MNKWQKKIDALSLHYDRTWDRVVEYHEQLGSPMPCARALRRYAYHDGAARMRMEILHLVRSKKYKVDKMIREGSHDHKAPLCFASALYKKLIEDLTQ